ncbi:DNA repair protein RecO [Porphyromonas pogonae]|uniref:DNA repair protein RecO n=1 Tax=Porphyromonas pogonae TaxID=867595 RepID=UPI002E77F9C4|nr:DNA repair protein RecO C-terminal domain-containing protein [Porphyromonas pogonae]
MLLETNAIVLHTTRYNDRFNILHTYSQEAGRVNLLVPAASRTSKGKKGKISYPLLAEIAFSCEVRAHRTLHYLKEAYPVSPHPTLQQHVAKQGIAIMLSEILYRILTVSEKDDELYHFVSQSLNLLESITTGFANFHLVFLLRLPIYLGISADYEDIVIQQRLHPHYWFDLHETRFVPSAPLANTGIPPSEAVFLPLIVRMNYSNMRYFRFNRLQRRMIIDHLISYYRLHLPPFPPLKSPDILKAMYD